ncbi:hypothetical protein Clacol_003723 [Clathrus columnatus]|uniref:DNA-binding protein RAP1 n=1 Tax=Clathrus columnatus TaxID=1419009 RepID=A0AAV5A973_9AGAM|nr:hypothetical protein Clacol_003723 [Clathrus columnatus]
MSSNIFYDSELKQPIKFFIQKNLEEIVQLERNIIGNGGHVQSKIPLRGFVLIEPGSPEAIRLLNCWMSPQNPRRYFVPHTFVQECMTAGKVLPQVFRKEDGSSRKFLIHTSVCDGIILKLSGQIQHSGGEVVKDKESAEIIIADERWDGFERLSIYYSDAGTKNVEGISWIRRSITSGALNFTVIKKPNVGGRITGSKRTEFTSQDDNNLARYIATKLPYPNMRGRTGNNLYKDLCGKTELYPWATRHPWQSWRERYRNNIDRFNNLIATFLEVEPDLRKPDAKHRDSNSEGGIALSPPKVISRQEISPSNDDQASTTVKSSEDWGGCLWPIKIGTREPPSWGKHQKRPLENQEINETSKRARTNSDTKLDKSNGNPMKSIENQHNTTADGQIEYMEDEQLNETRSPSSAEEEYPYLGEETQEFLEASRQMLNRGLMFDEGYKPVLIQIATQYRFLLDEVEEEFQRLDGDLQATEVHFKEIREYISQKRLTK